MGLNKLLIFLYLIGFINHIIMGVYPSIGFDFSHIKEDDRLYDLKIHLYRYLTTWNLMLQTFYFALAITIELMPLIQKKFVSDLLVRAKLLKGILFSSLVFGNGLGVSTIFWTLHLTNPLYIFPPGYEKILPLWVNHGIHTNILYLLIIEIALGQIFLPKYRVIFSIITLYCLTYTIQYVALYYATGRWLYGVMFFLTPTQNVLFIMFINIYIIALAALGIPIIKRKKNRFIPTKDEKRVCISCCV